MASPSPLRGPSPITKESLAAAAGRDDAAVKELLRGEDGERTGQVERVRLALDTLKRELPDAKKEEKARVARTARELMDEHLATVQNELKLKADTELADLEKKISNARDVAVEEERAATNIVSVEGVQLEVREITRELQHGDWKTWAKYAGIAIAGGIAAKWVWDHTIGWLWSKAAGDEEHPGFLRRATSWLVGLGGAAAAALGFSRFMGQNKGTLIPLATAVKEGAESGWRAGAGETLTRIADIAGDKGRTAEVKKKFEAGEYATEAEYNDALAEALFYDRVEIVWEGGVMHFIRSGVSLTINAPALVIACGKLLYNRDIDSGKEVLAIYVKGVVVYATSFGAVQGVLRAIHTRSFGAGLKTLATESALWPVQVFKKANDARYYMLTKEGRTYLRSAAGIPGYHWNRLMRMTGLRGGTAETAQLLIDEWRAWDELRLTARTAADAEFAAELNAKCAYIENELADVLKKLKPDAAGLTDDLKKLIDVGGDARSLATRLHEGTKAAAEGADAVAGADETVKAAEAAADAARTAGTAAESAESVAEWTKAAADVKKALLSPDATAEAIEAVEHAVQQCKTMGMAADDAVKILTESPHVLATLSKIRGPSAAPIALAFNEHGVKGLQRVSTFIAGIAEHLDDAARAGKLLDPKLLKTIAEADIAPEAFARIAANPALRKTLAESDDVARVMRQFIWWEHTLSRAGMLNVAGFAVSAVVLGVDIATYVDMRERLTKTIENLEQSLTQAGFERSGKHGFKHPQTKTEIDMRVLEKSIDSLSAEQAGRIAIDTVGTGAAFATLLAPSMALGPAGLVVLAVELTVHAGLTVAEDQRNRQFVLDTPAAVLAMIGMSQTVGKSEKDVIDESSSWLWSDFLHSADTNDTQKRELRKKAFSILFFREVSAMAKDAPDVAQEILGSHDPSTFLDEKNGQFWNVDFERVLKPFIAARLFQRSTDKDVRWSEFRDLKIDEGVTDWQNVSAEDVQLTLREAAHLYAQHLREMRYRDETRTLANLERTEGKRRAASIGDIDTRAYDELTIEATRRNAGILGAQPVFGAPVASRATAGSTAVERYVQGITAELDKRAAKTAAGKDTLEALGTKPFAVPDPADPSKKIRLENASIASERGQDVPVTAADVATVVAKGRALFDELKGVGTAMRQDSVWYAGASHMQKLKDFSYDIGRQPRIADQKPMREFLGSVTRLSERYSWEAALAGGSVSAERNDDFRAALTAMKRAVDSLEAHTYHVAPVEREKTERQTVALPDSERLLFSPNMTSSPGTRASVWIETNGRSSEYAAVDGAEKRYAVTGGTLICRSTPYLQKGTTVYAREWSYVRSPDEKGGKNFYAYTKFEGADQPGIRVDLPVIERKDRLVSSTLPGAYLPLSPQSLIEARLNVVYRDESGIERSVTDKGQRLFGKGIEPFRLTWVKSPAGEVVKFVPAAGITIVRCTVNKESDPVTVTYHLEDPRKKKESLVERRVRERREGRRDDATVAASGL